jgi:hypothetical protein
MSGYTMVTCHLRISTVKDNESRLLVLKVVLEGLSWPLSPTGELFLVRGKKKFGQL